MILNLPAATGARARGPLSKAYHAKDEGARLSIANARCWRISLAGARGVRAKLLTVLTLLLRPFHCNRQRPLSGAERPKARWCRRRLQKRHLRVRNDALAARSRSIVAHSRDTLMQLVQHSRSSSRLAQPARTASALKIWIGLCCCRTASSAVLCSSPAHSVPAPGFCSERPMSEAVGMAQSLPCVCISLASNAS